MLQCQGHDLTKVSSGPTRVEGELVAEHQHGRRPLRRHALQVVGTQHRALTRRRARVALRLQIFYQQMFIIDINVYESVYESVYLSTNHLKETK